MHRATLHVPCSWIILIVGRAAAAVLVTSLHGLILVIFVATLLGALCLLLGASSLLALALLARAVGPGQAAQSRVALS